LERRLAAILAADIVGYSHWVRADVLQAFNTNAVRLHLHALAYNLANFLRTLATPDEIGTWSLTSLRETLIKTGARLARHARYAVFQFAEAAQPSQMGNVGQHKMRDAGRLPLYRTITIL